MLCQTVNALYGNVLIFLNKISLGLLEFNEKIKQSDKLVIIVYGQYCSCSVVINFLISNHIRQIVSDQW